VRKHLWSVSLLALALTQFSCAALSTDSTSKHSNDDVPSIIVSGMDAYKTKGPDEAVKTWIKGSPVEGSKEALSQSNNLRQIQDFYGSYQSFDLISMRELSPSVRIYYLAMNFDKGPLFAKFILYRAEQGWILTSFLFNTSDTAILPTPSTK
jgi:hypothetical protein